MKTNNEFILDTLSKTKDLYVDPSQCEVIDSDKMPDQITLDNYALFRVDEITFEDKAPRKEALENVISSMCVKGINFVYIIIGDEKGVQFFYGVAKDFFSNVQAPLNVSEIGEKILKPSLQGNFRGSTISEVDVNGRDSIIKQLEDYKKVKILEGVPGINKDDEKFQSVDRLIDVMLGDRFALLIIAKPLDSEEINTIQEGVYHLYDAISPIAKNSLQQSAGENRGISEGTTSGSSTTTGTNSSHTDQTGSGTSDTHTDGKSSGTNQSTSQGTRTEKTSKDGSEGSHSDTSTSDAKGTSTSKSESDTTGESTSNTESTSESKTTQSGSNTGSATTLEIVNRKVQDWIKYMDDIVLPRLDYGLGKGMYITSTVLLGDFNESLIKLENTIRSVYGGETGNRVPLHAFDVDDDKKLLRHMQIPKIKYNGELNDDEIGVRTSCSQMIIEHKNGYLGNWMSSQEISLLAGVPQKEVVGLALREEVEFGLNPASQNEDSFLLGHLVQSGVVLRGKDDAGKDTGVPDIPVFFDKSYFDKHIFVTGVTGSGKTTTCQKLLLESNCSFLVIEPAKTEYRVLAEEDIPDLLVFTLGKENGAPFRLNPFEFFEGENITSRVDMIKASMEAAFDMEAAIPQLLEAAIYECYEDKGWDISTNKNHRYDRPFDDGVFSFPTLGDLETKIVKVVNDQGFDDKLRDEYIGSIRARLKGLTVGSKGQMLNTPRSIDFIELLDKKVVLELEYIKSASEKSLIMGFILTNLSEAIRAKYALINMENEKIDKIKKVNHLTLVEEAHRLLSKYMPGDSMNKKQGVEMFSDMLAEVRKYGESLIIADQIPNKLTPEVLKNTNTKIVHKIFAQDDKEAIGNTMALKDEQKNHLSYLASGRAIMMNPGLTKAIQVQILRTKENDTERVPISDSVLRDRIILFYQKNYKKGILPGLERFDKEPSVETIKLYLDYLYPSSTLVREYRSLVQNWKVTDLLITELNEVKLKGNIKDISRIICCICHKSDALVQYPEIFDYVEKVIIGIDCEGKEYNIRAEGNCRKLSESLA